MQNRLLLSLLLCGVLLYYGVPRLSIGAEGLEGIFALTWLLFALLAVSGNLIGLLYQPKVAKKSTNSATIRSNKRTKHRQYQ